MITNGITCPICQRRISQKASAFVNAKGCLWCNADRDSAVVAATDGGEDK